ncbi:MAG: VIT1/CCC1 transporter family protein [Patescibacteria group bacterium]|jgi:predicted membrane protein (TIGR00267 family)
MGSRLGEILSGSVREVVFGLEDSFVSTMGAVSGIAVGSGNSSIVLLSGFVLVGVEAISMAAGSYLSSKAATEVYTERFKQDEARVLSERVTDTESLRDFFIRKGFSKVEMGIALKAIGRERRLWLDEAHRSEFRLSPSASGTPLFAGFIMGICYVFGGLLVLSPYIFLPIIYALPSAILVTIVALFLLGFWKASVANVKPVRSGIEMVLVSLAAAFLGIVIGHFVSAYTGIAAS